MLVNMSESSKPANAVSFCPLCEEQVSSLREYARHVGRHQKHLALFALPRLDGADESDNTESEQPQRQEASVDSGGESSDDVSP